MPCIMSYLFPESIASTYLRDYHKSLFTGFEYGLNLPLAVPFWHGPDYFGLWHRPPGDFKKLQDIYDGKFAWRTIPGLAADQGLQVPLGKGCERDRPARRYGAFELAMHAPFDFGVVAVVGGDPRVVQLFHQAGHDLFASMLGNTRAYGTDQPALFAVGYEAMEPYGRFKAPDLHVHCREFNACVSAGDPCSFLAVDRSALAKFLRGPVGAFEYQLVEGMLELGYEVIQEDLEPHPTLWGLPRSLEAKFRFREIALLVCVLPEAQKLSKELPARLETIVQRLMNKLVRILSRCRRAKPAKQYWPLATMRQIWLHKALDLGERLALAEVVHRARLRSGGSSGFDLWPTPPWETPGKREGESAEMNRPTIVQLDRPEETFPTPGDLAWKELFLAECVRLRDAIAQGNHLVEELRFLRRLRQYVEIDDVELMMLEVLEALDLLRLPLAPTPAKDRSPSMDL